MVLYGLRIFFTYLTAGLCPLVLQKDLVIYEMNVRGFTADKSSGLDPSIRGSYLGVIEKVLLAYNYKRYFNT